MRKDLSCPHCLDLFHNLELFRGYRNDNRISSPACFKYFGNPIYDSFRCLRCNDLQITIDCHPAFIIQDLPIRQKEISTDIITDQVDPNIPALPIC